MGCAHTSSVSSETPIDASTLLPNTTFEEAANVCLKPLITVEASSTGNDSNSCRADGVGVALVAEYCAVPALDDPDEIEHYLGAFWGFTSITNAAVPTGGCDFNSPASLRTRSSNVVYVLAVDCGSSMAGNFHRNSFTDSSSKLDAAGAVVDEILEQLGHDGNVGESQPHTDPPVQVIIYFYHRGKPVRIRLPQRGSTGLSQMGSSTNGGWSSTSTAKPLRQWEAMCGRYVAKKLRGEYFPCGDSSNMFVDVTNAVLNELQSGGLECPDGLESAAIHVATVSDAMPRLDRTQRAHPVDLKATGSTATPRLGQCTFHHILIWPESETTIGAVRLNQPSSTQPATPENPFVRQLAEALERSGASTGVGKDAVDVINAPVESEKWLTVMRKWDDMTPGTNENTWQQRVTARQDVASLPRVVGAVVSESVSSHDGCSVLDEWMYGIRRDDDGTQRDSSKLSCSATSPGACGMMLWRVKKAKRDSCGTVTFSITYDVANDNAPSRQLTVSFPLSPVFDQVDTCSGVAMRAAVVTLRGLRLRELVCDTPTSSTTGGAVAATASTLDDDGTEDPYAACAAFYGKYTQPGNDDPFADFEAELQEVASSNQECDTPTKQCREVHVDPEVAEPKQQPFSTSAAMVLGDLSRVALNNASRDAREKVPAGSTEVIYVILQDALEWMQGELAALVNDVRILWRATNPAVRSALGAELVCKCAEATRQVGMEPWNAPPQLEHWSLTHSVVGALEQQLFSPHDNVLFPHVSTPTDALRDVLRESLFAEHVGVIPSIDACCVKCVRWLYGNYVSNAISSSGASPISCDVEGRIDALAQKGAAWLHLRQTSRLASLFFYPGLYEVCHREVFVIPKLLGARLYDNTGEALSVTDMVAGLGLGPKASGTCSINEEATHYFFFHVTPMTFMRCAQRMCVYFGAADRESCVTPQQRTEVLDKCGGGGLLLEKLHGWAVAQLEWIIGTCRVVEVGSLEVVTQTIVDRCCDMQPSLRDPKPVVGGCFADDVRSYVNTRLRRQ